MASADLVLSWYEGISHLKNTAFLLESMRPSARPTCA